MTTPAAAGSVSRGTLLNQPRSGAKPLGNSPGAGPGPSRAPSNGPAPSRPKSAVPPRASSSGRSRTSTAAPSRPRRAAAASSSSPRWSPQPAGGGGGKRGRPKDLSFKLPGGGGEYRNYQGIILAEFVAAELLVAATPMATRKNQPGISPYVPRDLVQLVAIGFLYLVLELVSIGGRGAGRVSAWLGALVLLTVGLTEAANIAKVFAFLTGGSGKPEIQTTAAAASPPTAIQQYLAAAPSLSASGDGGGSSSSAGGGSGPHSGNSFVSEAAKFIGRPYVFGAAGPSSFDCSGLVQYALEQMGVRNVPRTSEEQWGWVQRISQSQLAPGDLIFEQWPGEASPGHVAIYAGGGQIIQAPAPGEDVQRVKWSPSIVHSEGGQIVGYGRVPGLSYGGGSSSSSSSSSSARHHAGRGIPSAGIA